MPNWQKLARRARPVGGRPSVGIHARKGTISLNRQAFEALRSADAVEILFDPVERVIGFRAAPLSAASYPIHQQGTSATYLIAGRALARVMGIDTSRARRYDAALIDDVLTVDLNQAGVPVSAGAPRRLHDEVLAAEGR